MLVVRYGYIFAIGEFFPSQTRIPLYCEERWSTFLREEIPLISDKVVLENVHNLFFGHIGSFRFSCKGIPLQGEACLSFFVRRYRFLARSTGSGCV